jgi:hypothetical protein
MRPDPNIKTLDEIVSAGGADRLVLRYVLDPDDGEGLDFHSVAWEVRQGDLWFEHVVITAADFQRGNNRGRWVSALHHWNPVSGVAILQVGEEPAPRSTQVHRSMYSWREWDLRNNREIAVLRDCRSPFENPDGTKRPPRHVPW